MKITDNKHAGNTEVKEEEETKSPPKRSRRNCPKIDYNIVNKSGENVAARQNTKCKQSCSFCFKSNSLNMIVIRTSAVECWRLDLQSKYSSPEASSDDSVTQQKMTSWRK